MKGRCNKLMWLGVPILLAAGCAEHEREASVSYSPALTQPMSPTSDRAEPRVYSEPTTSADATAPPPGAASQDWALAEEIRSLLKSNPKLGDAPMAAVVKNGVVTLRGGVRNQKARAKIRDEISRLPGVERVDDEMELKNPLGIGAGETKSY